MGFNKRFVDMKIVKMYLNKGDGMDKLFKADAFIFLDKGASEIYKMYEKGATEEEIKLKVEEIDGQQTN